MDIESKFPALTILEQFWLSLADKDAMSRSMLRYAIHRSYLKKLTDAGYTLIGALANIINSLLPKNCCQARLGFGAGSGANMALQFAICVPFIVRFLSCD
ncbi:hypothetical protein EVAR_73857_1 [Eumeta japonica]|uniref:Uncharacterized protein n=1 Tax=Eumeta variegata TaxID=151549 RepID=A0A4C1TL20_EUMVA|nr:hypothetical protein EVAR_73857_1 [Eumeta japonica]